MSDETPLFTQKLIGFRGWSVEWPAADLDWSDPALMQIHAERAALQTQVKMLNAKVADLGQQLRVKEEVISHLQRGSSPYGYAHGGGYGVATGMPNRLAGQSLYYDQQPSEPRDAGLWTHSHTYWHPGKPARARCVQRHYEGGFAGRLQSSLLGGPKRQSRPLHKAPDPLCTCGLHAHYDLASTAYASMEPQAGWVVGVVAAWGRVEAHSNVFRAEYMQPVALGMDPGAPPSLTDKMERLARMYAVEIVALQDLAEHALKFGTPIPQEYRGAAKLPVPSPEGQRIPAVDLRVDLNAMQQQINAQLGQQVRLQQRSNGSLVRALRQIRGI